MTLTTLLFGLALTPVLSGGVDQERGEEFMPPADQATVVAGAAAEQLPADAPSVCEWQCQACEPGHGCEQSCTEVGDCGSTCSVIAQCDADHTWEEDSCSCVQA